MRFSKSKRDFLRTAAAAPMIFIPAGPSLFAAAEPELPSGAARAGTVRFAAFGDMGTGDKPQFEVAARIAAYHRERPFETLIFLGDNIYNDGNPADLPHKFYQPYSELMKRNIEFRGVLGNHDVRHPDGPKSQMKLLNMGETPYYTFTRGGGLVEFFMLETTSLAKGGGAEQLKWLESVLAASKARWKVACFHHPLYSSARTHGLGSHDEKVMFQLRDRIEPLFVKYRVNAVFNGHDHVYERIRLQQGIQHFISGSGGQLRHGDLDPRSPYTAFGNDKTRTFMYLEATADKFSFWSVDVDGKVLDSGLLPEQAKAKKSAA